MYTDVVDCIRLRAFIVYLCAHAVYDFTSTTYYYIMFDTGYNTFRCSAVHLHKSQWVGSRLLKILKNNVCINNVYENMLTRLSLSRLLFVGSKTKTTNWIDRRVQYFHLCKTRTRFFCACVLTLLPRAYTVVFACRIECV